VTRLAVEGVAQAEGDWVVLLGGGYDRRFDSPAALGSGGGNSLYAVDAVTGQLLWSAGDTDDDDLSISGLASLPSAPRALELDGDGYLDRAYLVDVRGHLWRLDFESGAAPGALARASSLADLGDGERRFHATPDASSVRIGNVSVLAVAVGSGWVAHPRDIRIADRMYVVFDHDAEPAPGLLKEEDLHDATSRASIPASARGWYYRLEAQGAGEKIIGPGVTFDRALRFHTYQPLEADPAEPCGPPRGIARRYTLDVRSGLPHSTVVESEEEEPETEEMPFTGLPVELRFGFPGEWNENCVGCRPRPFGMDGPAAFDTGYSGDPVKTSWRKLNPPPASR
jgi:type IV pilus assembly protein PilY1